MCRRHRHRPVLCGIQLRLFHDKCVILKKRRRPRKMEEQIRVELAGILPRTALVSDSTIKRVSPRSQKNHRLVPQQKKAIGYARTGRTWWAFATTSCSSPSGCSSILFITVERNRKANSTSFLRLESTVKELELKTIKAHQPAFHIHLAQQVSGAG